MSAVALGPGREPGQALRWTAAALVVAGLHAGAGWWVVGRPFPQPAPPEGAAGVTIDLEPVSVPVPPTAEPKPMETAGPAPDPQVAEAPDAPEPQPDAKPDAKPDAAPDAPPPAAEAPPAAAVEPPAPEPPPVEAAVATPAEPPPPVLQPPVPQPKPDPVPPAPPVPEIAPPPAPALSDAVLAPPPPPARRIAVAKPPKPVPPRPAKPAPPKPDPREVARQEARELAREQAREAQAEARQQAREEARQQARAQRQAARDQARAARAAAVREGGGEDRASAAPVASGAAVSSWRGEVVAHLNAYKPASPNGSGGTVRVAFSVDRGGRVTSAAVSGSSGDPELDQAAVSMVRRASPVPAPPPEMGGRISLAVPVRFH